MKTACLLVVAVALGGCATSRTITGQDGKPVHKISCDGAVQSIDACYEKAGELCGSAGYDVLNQGGDATPFFFASGNSFSSGAVITRTVFARCRT
ncbi:hypothetical protein [Variovorax sp. RCC_210]|uniref:hypothetical protein n=1 Tax=Variovorax sp. RCC_210 TaxID=3239217 RepID=UPI0035263BCE